MGRPLSVGFQALQLSLTRQAVNDFCRKHHYAVLVLMDAGSGFILDRAGEVFDSNPDGAFGFQG